VKSSIPLGLTELVLRDAHQSLLATRLRLDDMLEIAPKLDAIGYWSLETWGGATFDACIRYLGEDPWARLRALKKAMPKTQQQMLLRGQNILGYRHYADDVVDAFVEKAAVNGMDVFRIFDAMNDPRNMQRAIQAVRQQDKHAQACLSYTVSPVHDLKTWLELADKLQEMGADSIAIKDMAGLLKPYDAFELVSQLKARLDIPLHMQCHATTGMSTATALKAIEAGIDNIDTAISSMSMTYGHSPTETVVAILEETLRATGLDLIALQEVADYFRKIRQKYAKFEGSLRGVDARILTAQVPGGMLTNMESQLKAQGALHRFSEVLEEIPRVRQALGYIPLVTPTSQIVGTQAVLNVLGQKPYETISKETQAILKGEYGAAPAPFDKALQAQVLQGSEPITVRPADLLQPELARLSLELKDLAEQDKFQLGPYPEEDVLTYALFNHVALRFFKNRHNPDAFEPAPIEQLPSAAKDTKVSSPAPATTAANTSVRHYQVEVDGEQFNVTIGEGAAQVEGATKSAQPSKCLEQKPKKMIKVPLTGTILKLLVAPGETVVLGQALVLLEAMKMETQVVAEFAGVIDTISVKAGDNVDVGQVLMGLK